MKLTKEAKLMIFFSIFCIFLVSLYFFNLIEKKNAPKIVLISNKNPLEVAKPNPVVSDLNLVQINQILKDIEIKNDKSLEIDDIE